MTPHRQAANPDLRDLQALVAQASNPRYETVLALNFFNVHAAILPEPQKPKNLR
jgi:hypothetical protein